MKNINLKHLHYFWAVAHEGSIAAASERLFITPQTISAQLKQLESRLDQQLFHRSGKTMSLTPAGETALAYADQIFDLGKELAAALSSEADGINQLRVGISDVVPKLIASLILLPTIQHSPAPRLVCRESDASDLLAQLGQHKLDLVLSDHPAPPDPNLRLYSHKMGSTGISFMAAPALVPTGPEKFPHTLNKLPILLPGRRTALRMTLENWLEENNVNMRVAGEFDDSALTKAFGQIGAGIFTCPTAIEAEVSRQYAVQVIGRTKALKENFYLISPNKKISQPLVIEVLERARRDIFQMPA